MVEVDNRDTSNETVEVKETTVVKEEKVLNNDSASGVDQLAESLKNLAVDPVGKLSEQLDEQLCLGTSETCQDKGTLVHGHHSDDGIQLVSRGPPGRRVPSQHYAEEKREEDSDEEGTIVYGGHKDNVELISRGPPGMPTESEYYSSNISNLVSTIQSTQPGTKRRHNQPVDPLSKGFKPHDVPEITRTQNQLSGGSLKCTPRAGKPTVRELLDEREQQQQQQQQQQMFLLQQQQQQHQLHQLNAATQPHQQFPSGQPTLQQQPGNIVNKFNIPPDSILPLDSFLFNDDDGRLPSFDDADAILRTLEESEALTKDFNPQVMSTQSLQQKQTTEVPQTDFSSAAMRRVRNQPSISDTSSSGPRTPESGYQTSSSAPSSPKSVSSRRSWGDDQKSFEEESQLPEEVEEQLRIADEVIKDMLGKELQESENKTQQPLCQFESNGQKFPETPAPYMTIATPAPQPAPLQFPGQPNQPLVLNFVPSYPQKPCTTKTTQGKGRPPNSKGKGPMPTRQRMLLPKPAPQPHVQFIPTTVTGAQPLIQATPNIAPTRNSVGPCGFVQHPNQVTYPPTIPVAKKETTKVVPIAPKAPERGDSLMKRSLTDILTDSKLKIRAHRQIVGKLLEEIVKKDADGDTWLHSYIMYLNDNKDVVYMINAIISRLKREHNEGKINIKQVINTQNNNSQTPVYLATVMNNQYVLDWLLKAGGDPNIVAISTTPTGSVRKGPLHYAASRGDESLDVLYTLLENRDTDLNLKNTDGLSPLHVAVQSHGKPIPNSQNHINSTRVIAALIQKGANLEEVDDKNGKTPIHNLVESQSYELISAIFNVIPEPDLKRYLRKQDFRGNTALHIAAQCAMASIDDHKKVVKLLLEKGADPSMKNAENLTASQLAFKPHKDELGPLLKPTLGKSIHNVGSPAAYNAMSPSSQQTTKVTTKKPSSPVAPQTFIVLHAMPTTTTQMVTVPGMTQPVQSQVQVASMPQSTINCTIPSSNQTVTYTQLPQQTCYTTPVNSPQMNQVLSPQMAQSPPQVHSPEMSQANHDFTLATQIGPTSPPQLTATTCITNSQGNLYQINNPVR